MRPLAVCSPPHYKSKGYYASWLQSASMIGALLSSYAWGMFADRFGRKPVLLIGVCAIGVFAITFGLSESLAQALASRCARASLCRCVWVWLLSLIYSGRQPYLHISGRGGRTTVSTQEGGLTACLSSDIVTPLRTTAAVNCFPSHISDCCH